MVFTTEVALEFEVHAKRLRDRSRARLDAVRFKSVLEDGQSREAEDEDATLGKPLPGETFAGDTNLRTLRALLLKIDGLGYERSAHQLRFHSAFERSIARVVYKKDWATSRPLIMKKNGWERCSSEVLISTPRRFGKTFSCAAHCTAVHTTLTCAFVAQHRNLHGVPSHDPTLRNRHLLARQTCLSKIAGKNH